MSAVPHTPGPWSYEGIRRLLRFGSKNPMSAGLDDLPHNGDRMPCDGDARLIAAAPSLLCALEDLLNNMGRPPDSNCSCHISPPCNDCVDHAGLREAIEIAERVVVEAEGRAE